MNYFNSNYNTIILKKTFWNTVFSFVLFSTYISRLETEFRIAHEIVNIMICMAWSKIANICGRKIPAFQNLEIKLSQTVSCNEVVSAIKYSPLPQFPTAQHWKGINSQIILLSVCPTSAIRAAFKDKASKPDSLLKGRYVDLFCQLQLKQFPSSSTGRRKIFPLKTCLSLHCSAKE